MTKWIKNVTREVTPFPALGVTKSFGQVGKTFDIPFNYEHIIFVKNSWWYQRADYQKIQSIFREKIDNNPSYIDGTLKHQREKGESLKKYIKQVSTKKFSKATFLTELPKYQERMIDFYSFWWMAIPAGEILEEKIRPLVLQKQTDIQFEDLLFVRTELELMRERRLLAKLGLEVGQCETFDELDLKLKKKLENHAQEFGWITTSYHIGEALAAEDFFSKIKSTDPSLELQSFDAEHTKQSDVLEKIARVFSRQEMDLVRTMQEIIYLRNYQKETVNECQHKSEPFLTQGADFLAITLNDFLLLSLPEMLTELKSVTPNRDEIKSLVEKRKQKFGIELSQGEVSIFDTVETLESEVQDEVSIDSVSEIKGSAACKGKVSGKVKVISKKDDLKLFKKGEVMVTTMTNIDYIQSMKEAVGIITDEGGITCHAAIFSREFNIPCIIGTKIATKVLKDGDMVEVDAEKGIVRKI